MKRLARIVLNMLTALSLVLCLATVALWVRSYRAGDVVSVTQNVRGALTLTQTAYALGSGNGVVRASMYRLTVDGWLARLRLDWAKGFPHEQPGWHARLDHDSPASVIPFAPEWPFLGIAKFARVDQQTSTPTAPARPGTPPATQTEKRRFLWVRYRTLLIVAGLLPALRLARLFGRERRERIRQSRGLCPKCGYDLRATPDRCPECGTAPEAAKA